VSHWTLELAELLRAIRKPNNSFGCSSLLTAALAAHSMVLLLVSLLPPHPLQDGAPRQNTAIHETAYRIAHLHGLSAERY
jgi:hypothetical protein